MRPLFSFAAALCLSALVAGVTGCGTGTGIVVLVPPTPPLPNECGPLVSRQPGPTATSNYAGTSFTVTVKAGSQPMIGASVQLYAAGNTGNGLAPKALLSAPLNTDATGAVSVPASFTCPFNLSTLYVVARGGKAGASGSVSTGNVLISVLGTCASVTPGSAFVVNEATTVAGTYAMAQFLSAGANLGASATNFSGLSLAAATAANLVNPNTGAIGGATFPATGTAPTGMLASLANLLNACIVAPGASACSQLYTATAVSSATPTNTLDALLNLVRHPATNVTTLFALSQGSTAYGSALTAAPSDFTLFVSYAGGGMNAPSGLGIDSAGNVRVSNYNDVLSYFNNTGVPTPLAGITGNNLHDSYGLAVDHLDRVWVPIEERPVLFGSIGLFDNNGNALKNLTGGGINYPVAIAIGPDGTSWTVDYGKSQITLTDANANFLSGTDGFTSPQFVFPVAVAINSKCYGFIANQSGTTITRVSPNGQQFDSYSTGYGASGLAIDGADNVWVANYYGSTIGLLSSTGTVVSSTFSGGGIKSPQGLAVDGAGNLWVANFRGPTITELAAASSSTPGAILSSSTGYGKDASLLNAFAIAIDASGNVWITSFGDNRLVEFVGLAAPVKTPILGAMATP